MANSVFQAMNPSKGAMGPKGGAMGPTPKMGPSGGPMEMIQQFPRFMQGMRGKDPAAIMQQLVSTGRISQAQLDQAQQMAQRMAGQFNGFRSMFGFK